VEPASAASVAGLKRLARERKIAAGSTIVCVLTGHGLKDPDTALAQLAPPESVPADADTVAAALRLA
jgi:threonine synthase